MRALLAVLVVSCGAAPPSVAPSNASPATPPTLPKDPAGMHTFLASLAKTRFDRGVLDRGCPADQTLGEYIASLERGGNPPGEPSDPTDTFELKGGCGPFPAELIPIDPPADPAYAFCKIDSYRVDAAGESPWHYELHVRVERSNGKVDLATIACPGA